MAKLNFQHHSVSHDTSEIILTCWFAAQETFLILNVKQLFCLICFVQTVIHFLGLYDEYNVQKGTTESFYNMNVINK